MIIMMMKMMTEKKDDINHEGVRNDFDDAEMNSMIMIPMIVKIII
jgi:hypothetical protein